MSDINTETSFDDSPLWSDEIDAFYDVLNKDPGTIAFRKSHPTYLTLKSAMAIIGIDINAITTEKDLIDLEIEYEKHLNDFVVARVVNSQPKSLESRLVKARLCGDNDEALRLRQLLQKRNEIGLHLI